MMKTSTSSSSFWVWAVMAILLKLLVARFSKILVYRPEIVTPVTSLRRLAEGYWLKQSGLSPYAGSMYHGSPLLLLILGPLAVKRTEDQLGHVLCSVFILIDIITAVLIRGTGHRLQRAYSQSLSHLNLAKKTSSVVTSGDVAALIHLWNPMALVTCAGLSTTPVENFMVVLSLYGACSRLVPLAAFGWVISTHLSLYPAVLVLPIILLLGHGPDAPPKKLYRWRNSSDGHNDHPDRCTESASSSSAPVPSFSWKPVVHFVLWASFWWMYVLALCAISLRNCGGLSEMFKKTYGFILLVEDLSPNIGILWYFFAEVFSFFREFFLIIFHMNILLMIPPLAIRLNHRPCFLAFVYIAICSMLKSYPSLGDSALYLSLLGLFANDLTDMNFSFMLVCGYIGVSLFSPVMHNLWIWRGTGNANFYFAVAIAYACLQIILIVESVSAVLNRDRMLRINIKHID